MGICVGCGFGFWCGCVICVFWCYLCGRKWLGLMIFWGLYNVFFVYWWCLVGVVSFLCCVDLVVGFWCYVWDWFGVGRCVEVSCCLLMVCFLDPCGCLFGWVWVVWLGCGFVVGVIWLGVELPPVWVLWCGKFWFYCFCVIGVMAFWFAVWLMVVCLGICVL